MMSNLLEVKLSIDPGKPEQVAALVRLVSVLGGTQEGAPKNIFAKKNEEAKKEPVKTTEKKVVKQTKKVVQDKPEESSQDASEIKELCRIQISEKGKTSRDKIKTKLTELGATSVTTLKDEHAQEFLDFLQKL